MKESLPGGLVGPVSGDALSIYYCSKFPKSSVIKRTQKQSDKAATQILAEICQNRTTDKTRIFEGFSVAQIKKC
jgi:hypothetical protein